MTQNVVETLAMRLARPLAGMRQDALDSVELWLESFDAGMGGTLVMQAPCTHRKRSIPEAGFATERFKELCA